MLRKGRHAAILAENPPNRSVLTLKKGKCCNAAQDAMRRNVALIVRRIAFSAVNELKSEAFKGQSGLAERNVQAIKQAGKSKQGNVRNILNLCQRVWAYAQASTAEHLGHACLLYPARSRCFR